MSWQDEARANGYVRAALNSNNEAELERNMQIADKAVDNADKILNGAANAVGNVISGIGRVLTEPSPPPKTSGGGGLGLLVAGVALAGGAYLLSKAFGGSDEKESKQVSQKQQKTSSSSLSNDTRVVQSKRVVKNKKSKTKKSANDYLNIGDVYFEDRKYELAIQEYSNAIKLNPNYALAFKKRGKAYQAIGNSTSAQADFALARMYGYNG